MLEAYTILFNGILRPFKSMHLATKEYNSSGIRAPTVRVSTLRLKGHTPS